MTLTEFLLARIAEDEAAAVRVELCPYFGSDFGIGMLHVSAARVLAECEAKRRIVERWRDLAYEVEQAERLGDYDAAPVATAFAYEQVAQVLTQPYADHPDFNPAWRL